MWRKWLPEVGILVVLAILGVGIYSNSLQNGFHYDDLHHIVKNPHIRDINNIPSFFTDPGTFSLKYKIHRKEKKMSLSEEAYRKAIQIEPRSIPAHVGLAKTYFDQGKFSFAAQEYQESLRIDPTNLDARTNLGLVYIWWGKLDLAQKELLKVLEMDPKYQYARTNMDLIEKIKSKNISSGDSFRQ